MHMQYLTNYHSSCFCCVFYLVFMRGYYIIQNMLFNSHLLIIWETKLFMVVSHWNLIFFALGMIKSLVRIVYELGDVFVGSEKKSGLNCRL